MNTKIIGDKGELIATKYLKKHKYKILDNNYRCHFGEIDIIATIAGIVVFIEVKTRQNGHYGLGRESVNYTKQGHIIASAKRYIMENDLHGIQTRFDVIEVGQDSVSEHLIDAFRP